MIAAQYSEVFSLVRCVMMVVLKIVSLVPSGTAYVHQYVCYTGVININMWEKSESWLLYSYVSCINEFECLLFAMCS